MINPENMYRKDRMGTIHDCRYRGPNPRLSPVNRPVKMPQIGGIAPKALLLIGGAILLLFLIFKK